MTPADTAASPRDERDRHYIFLTNIPAPYRVALYNALAHAGFDFEVFYMRETEAGRAWGLDPSRMRHRYFVDRGFYSVIGHYHLHINPRLITKVLQHRTSEIVIAGGWNDFDVLALVTLKRLGLLPNRLHFWSEANYLTAGARRDNPIKRFVRKYVYNSSRGAQISSGRMTEITMERWGITPRPIVPLPNTIDEEHLAISPSELDQRWANSEPTFLIPARLVESIKGIINFFRAIGDDNTRRAQFLLAGEGPDEGVIREFVHARGLTDHVEFLGYCEPERLANAYKRSHAVLLPSFTDASPLALVEALRMHLPILASERCGNHFETVDAGVNGFLCDPDDMTSIRTAFESLMARRDGWRAMGEISAAMYAKTFQRDLVIERFIKAFDALPAR